MKWSIFINRCGHLLRGNTPRHPTIVNWSCCQHGNCDQPYHSCDNRRRLFGKCEAVKDD